MKVLGKVIKSVMIKWSISLIFSLICVRFFSAGFFHDVFYIDVKWVKVCKRKSEELLLKEFTQARINSLAQETHQPNSSKFPLKWDCGKQILCLDLNNVFSCVSTLIKHLFKNFLIKHIFRVREAHSWSHSVRKI